MAKKTTRKEDAASIVGEELAEQIEKGAAVHKADYMIEMSEAEETAELIAEIEPTPATEPVTEPVVEAVPEPVAEPATEPAAQVVAKSEDDVIETAVNEVDKEVEGMPYGGAISMRQAEAKMAQVEENFYLMDMWSVLSTVVYNIFERKDVEDKRAALNIAIDEFKNILTAKAMVAFSTAVVESDPHPLQPAIDSLLEAVDNSMQVKSDYPEKLMGIQPSLEELGKAITDLVQVKSVATETPAQNENKDILQEIQKLIQPISESVSQLAGEVGILKSQAAASGFEAKSRIPAPRTQVVSPALVAKSDADKPKPGSLRYIIERSLGQ